MVFSQFHPAKIEKDSFFQFCLDKNGEREVFSSFGRKKLEETPKFLPVKTGKNPWKKPPWKKLANPDL